MNHLQKYYLVKAEWYRIHNRSQNASQCYNKAISLAKQNEYKCEEALANELAGKFHLSMEKDDMAAVYIVEAYHCYLKWEAHAKVQHLIEQYPQFLACMIAKKGP